ncbi:glycosyltransferase family 25 [Lecanosticta acicola]|uniref:Glycosyltransferase family 25 n=1 Tax=Lecanosticta acicola TaxID=111012 RepID=A0AAI8Z8V2_9PEZI|nr:glycosyltransferase family 25 [Lecanosticta acicola]
MAARYPTLRVALAVAGSLTLLILAFAIHRGWTTNAHSKWARILPASTTSNSYSSAGLQVLQDVFNETLGFQKIFVINLPSRTDRRDTISLAAALTGLKIDFVDGVTDWDERILPPGATEANLGKGNTGAWRAHMNVARTTVEQNLTSALVLEADVDWDIRIKSQMQDFAKASQLLLQPDRANDRMYVSEHMPRMSSSSPYGDVNAWDLLWIGHCGTHFPSEEEKDIGVPAGRVAIPDDETVPESQHVNIQFGNDDLINQYPNHTRVVSRARMNVCTLAYGMSQQGARRFLYQLGIKRIQSATDIMFRDLCDGLAGRPLHACLTVQPQLFQHHRPVGAKSTFSEIANHGEEYNERAFTRNVRWSTRLNYEKLLYGKTDFVDLFPDGEPATDLGF